MHGVPDLFASPYTEDEVAVLSEQIPKTKKAFIFFNNTMYEAGYSNAQLLQQCMQKHEAV
jgi:uncharacterized protein YecE (DUF72 family)